MRHSPAILVLRHLRAARSGAPVPLRAVPLLTLASLVLACSGADADDAGGPAVAVRDSAGVAIVENGDPADLPEWTVWRTLEIGSMDGEGPESLFRLSAATSLPDGGVAVVNGGTAEVRVFGPDGTFVRALGRRGEGPGEFRSPGALWRLPGDSLLVWDYGLRRLTTFGPDGEVGAVTRIEGEVSNPGVVSVFADGSLLVSDERFEVPESGYVPVPLNLARYARDGRTVLDSLPGAVRMDIGIWDLGEGSVRLSRRLFGAFGWVVGDPEGWWYGFSRERELVRYDRQGTVERIARWQGLGRTVTPAELETHLQEATAELPPERREQALRQRSKREVAERFPAFAYAVGSADGGVWLQGYPRPGGEPNPPWMVLDREGRLVAQVRLPERFRPFEVGRDHVLGVERDDLDVERLVRFEILREEAVEAAGG